MCLIVSNNVRANETLQLNWNVLQALRQGNVSPYPLIETFKCRMFLKSWSKIDAFSPIVN